MVGLGLPVAQRGVPVSRRGQAPADAVYVPYPRALQMLTQRLQATADELAAWVFLGPGCGGLSAFLDAQDGDPLPFSFALFDLDHDLTDYLSPLMATWYDAGEVAAFQPQDRFITARALIQRWSERAGLVPKPFVLAKVREERLREVHPMVGLSEASSPNHAHAPMESTLFYLADVLTIEQQDLGIVPGPEPTAPSKPRPAWARDFDSLAPIQKAQRIFQRQEELRRQGVRGFQKQVADDLGITTARVKEYLAKLRTDEPSPMPGVVAALAGNPRRESGKP